MNAQPWEEFCPRCGHWHTALDERTGWCATCIGATPGGTPCRRCGRPKPPDDYRGDKQRGICRQCRTATRKAWRQAHLEHESREDARRRRVYGRGRCPICGFSKQLGSKGQLTSHQPTNKHWVTGLEKCPGIGQLPDSRPDTAGHSKP